MVYVSLEECMRKSEFQEEYTERTSNENEILQCLVGSQAYGTATPQSDFDYKSIYISPESEVIGILKEKEAKRYSPDDQSFSLRHFFRLCIKCVPNVMELLFCEEDCVVMATKEGQLLRQERNLFLSKNCVEPYIGYAQAQIKKSAIVPLNRGLGRQEIVAEFGYDTKFAMHTIRLLQTAEELLKDGVLRVKRPNRDFLLDIRFGRAFKDYEDFKKYAGSLIDRVRSLESGSILPERPDIESINRLVIAIQKQYWAENMQERHML